MKIKRISEKNIFPSLELYDEYSKIDKMLRVNRLVEDYNYCYTVEEYIDEYCFKNWELRGTFFSISEMRKALGISVEELEKETMSPDKVLEYLQYAINIIARAENCINKEFYHKWTDDAAHEMIVDNILELTKQLGCKLSIDEITGEFFVEYSDELAEEVSINYPDVKSSLGEYKRIDNQGNLIRKAEILCTLYKKLESFSEKFQGTTYKNLYDDTKLLFNKSGIRHNVDKDPIARATFLSMNEQEIELWYDKTYDMFLACLVIAKYLETKKEIDNIKRTI